MSDLINTAIDRVAAEFDLLRTREAFTQALAEERRNGVTAKQVATQIGVGHSTLNAWKDGTYNGDDESVGKKVSAWLLTRQERARTAETVRRAPTFMRTRTATEMLDVLEYAQTAPDMAVIAGGAGVGKTSTILNYQAVGSRVFLMTARPSINTIGAMLQMLGFSLRIQKFGSNYAMSLRIQEALSGTGGLVIVDEAQNLSPLLRDELRSIVFDGAGIGVALVGNEELNSQLGRERATGQYAQLVSRVGQRMSRPRPYKADVELLLTGWGLMNPEAREVALGIAMKPGALRQMAKTLAIAFALSDARQEDEPTADDIMKSWKQLGGMGE